MARAVLGEQSDKVKHRPQGSFRGKATVARDGWGIQEACCLISFNLHHDRGWEVFSAPAHMHSFSKCLMSQLCSKFCLEGLETKQWAEAVGNTTFTVLFQWSSQQKTNAHL